MPSSGGIKPLTCTIFDPIYFGGILSNHIVHISPTRLKNSIMVNYLDFGPKMAHRGNTGSHRGVCITAACAGMKLLANNLDDMYRNVMSKIDDVEDIYNPGVNPGVKPGGGNGGTNGGGTGSDVVRVKRK